MASIIPTLKHLVGRAKRVPRMDSIEEEDVDSPLTPKKFEESFLKGQCNGLNSNVKTTWVWEDKKTLLLFFSNSVRDSAG